MKEMTERLEIRLTKEEADRIAKRMEETGIRNRSAYVRKMALNGYSIQMDLSDVKEMVRLLRIYGNNLNQYAKVANERGAVWQADIREVQRGQKEIWLQLRRILKRLGEIRS